MCGVLIVIPLIIIIIWAIALVVIVSGRVSAYTSSSFIGILAHLGLRHLRDLPEAGLYLARSELYELIRSSLAFELLLGVISTLLRNGWVERRRKHLQTSLLRFCISHAAGSRLLSSAAIMLGPAMYAVIPLQLFNKAKLNRFCVEPSFGRNIYAESVV